ncbi:hypothetical protein Halar_2663 [halophilic archaeon DL31]|jgi:hypothetical protein|nr:hypothetical protein Halar_2663 [halophilic archaeon DL31]
MNESRSTAGFAEMARTMRRAVTAPAADGGVPELFDG